MDFLYDFGLALYDFWMCSNAILSVPINESQRGLLDACKLGSRCLTISGMGGSKNFRRRRSPRRSGKSMTHSSERRKSGSDRIHEVSDVSVGFIGLSRTVISKSSWCNNFYKNWLYSLTCLVRSTFEARV